MTNDESTNGSRTQAREPARRRFLHHLAWLTGGILLAPLFARASATSAVMPATRKVGRVIVFHGSDAGALAARVDALGYAWTTVSDQAKAHAAALAGETVAVVGTDAGAAAALRFARNHASVRAVFVVGENHGDALEEFRALQAPRAYAVQVLGDADAVDWQGASRWLDQHMA